jgi:hypothetical protein
LSPQGSCARTLFAVYYENDTGFSFREFHPGQLKFASLFISINMFLNDSVEPNEAAAEGYLVDFCFGTPIVISRVEMFFI